MLEEILAEAKDGSEYIEEQVFEKEALQEFDASKIEFKDIKGIIYNYLNLKYKCPRSMCIS